MGSLKRRFRKIKKYPRWLFFFPVLLMRLYFLLIRKKVIDPHNTLDISVFPYVCVTWHNRLLMFPAFFPRRLRIWAVAMVSASRDGQYLSDVLYWFGIGTVRGSSSKRGVAALQGGLKAIKDGLNLCLTPDGPRGPRYMLSKGAIHIASVTGRPINLVAIIYDSYWELKSWDRFQIPKPFSKATIRLGDFIWIPPDLNDEQLEYWRRKVENALNEVSEVPESERVSYPDEVHP